MTKAVTTLVSRFPHDNSLVAEYEVHTETEVDQIIGAVSHAQREWAKSPVAGRAHALSAVARLLEQRAPEWGLLMTREMGKPVSQAEAEVRKCAWVCDYYAEQAAHFLASSDVQSAARRSSVVFNPLGVVLAIMPWNFPFWQALRFAAPAIAAGNGIVLKHASNVSGCAMALEALFAACLPENLVRTLLVPSDRVAAVIGDDRIQAVTFTGSTDAGRKVGGTAGASLKKCVLELGGSDPYIVLDDADIPKAASVCASARLVNAGQSCIAGKRFIVVDKVYDQFLEAFTREMTRRRFGDPLDPDTEVGPMARADLAEELRDQVDRSVRAGARLVAGGEVSGAYFPPTVLAEVRSGMAAFDEELFGPVAAVVNAMDEEEAIVLANKSEFGLAGAVFTADVARGRLIAEEKLATGTVAINGQVQSDPRLPFGGIKHSGYGRELGEFGIREFVNIKTVSEFE